MVYGVAAGMTDRNDQQEILDAGKHVVAESESLLREVKGIVEVPHQPNKKAKLSQVSSTLCPYVQYKHATSFCLYFSQQRLCLKPSMN